MNDTDKRWYVVYVGDQKRIPALPSAVRSAVMDSAVWIPEKKVYLKIRGKNREMTRPLFPGYVFINIDIQAGNVEDAVQSACGGHFLKSAGSSSPTALSESEMKHLRQLADDRSTPQTIAQRYDLEIEQKVEISQGPFLGTVGVIKEIKKEKVVVEVSIFGRNVLAEVDPAACFIVHE